MSDWSFMLCDATGASLGKLDPAFKRTYSPALLAPHAATCVIREDNSLYTSVDPDGPGNFLRVLDPTGALRLFGPIVGMNEQGGPDGPIHMTITAADQSWELSKRIIASYHTNPITGVDVGQAIFDMLTTENGTSATGIVTGNKGTYFTRKDLAYSYQYFLQIMNELAAFSGSYEWNLRYVDVAAPYTSAPTINLDLVAAVGTDRHASVFLEYNCGRRNIAGFGRTSSIDTGANAITVLGVASGVAFGNAQQGVAVTVTDGTSITAHAARWEDVIHANLTTTSLATNLANQHLLVRKNARRLVTLQASKALGMAYGTDYLVGDKFTARVQTAAGGTLVNGTMRVWGVDVAIDDLGAELPTFRLQP